MKIKDIERVQPGKREGVNRREALGMLYTGIVATGAASLASAEPSQSGTLTGQVALVTGAGRGIGRAISVAYAQAGADVAILDIADADLYRKTIGYSLASDADLKETARQIEATGRRSLSIKVDVTDADAMATAVKKTIDTFGKIDIFVANAGIATRAPMHELPAALWTTVIDVNLNGVAHGIRAVLPNMIANNYGRVITIASVLGRKGGAGLASYCASKWGVIGLTKATALDVGKQGITVNSIAPSGVKTGIWGDMANDPKAMAALDVQIKQSHALDVGLLEPEDIADAALYLASPAAGRISGSVIDVAAGGNASYTA